MAAQRKNKVARELLIEFGANPKRMDKQGKTAAGIAESSGNIELSRMFQEASIGPVPLVASPVDAVKIMSSSCLAGQIRELVDLKAGGCSY